MDDTVVEFAMMDVENVRSNLLAVRSLLAATPADDPARVTTDVSAARITLARAVADLREVADALATLQDFG